MDIDFLKTQSRLLLQVELKPIQGSRFQPTGFPGLGAATYQSAEGIPSLLVESAQSMANRLEQVCWDNAELAPVAPLRGISHITVNHHAGKFLTDSMLEAHRLNSPYILEGKKDKTFANQLKAEVDEFSKGPIDRAAFARLLLKYDINSLIHGVFISKSDLAGGRLRMARCLTAFIEADKVQVAASGGVKNDAVNPQGDTGKGFGNVPFARDEFTAERITLYANIDVAQIRGYRLEEPAQDLLLLMCLFKIRRLLNGEMRLRTACDLVQKEDSTWTKSTPSDFRLPTLTEIENELPSAVEKCAPLMTHTQMVYADELKKKERKKT